MSGLYSAPPNLIEVRARLFSASETQVLAAADFEAYWPHVDNVWSSLRKARTYPDRIVAYFRCRKYRKKDHMPEGEGTHLRKRQKPAFSAIGCPMEIRVVTEAGSVTVQRIGTGVEHLHSLEDSDRWKRPSFVRQVAAREVANGYPVANVARNLRGVDRPKDRQALQEAGGHWLSLKDVHNAGAAWKKENPDSRRDRSQGIWQEQALKVQEWLEKEGWHVDAIQATRQLDGEQSHGLVFAEPARLKTLCRRGHFVLMDSTHDTNRLGWFLYNLLIRNEHGVWIPGAHLFTAREDSDIVAAGLQVIKYWCGERWLLRYMLTDDSAGEQCAVRKAFQGLVAGEQEVTHLLCKVHSRRAMIKALPGEANQRCREHLMAALYNRKTKPGCEESIQAAIKAAPEHRRNYIEKEWWKTRADWANYTRCHSALLLQVGSTNVVESWHASLKHGVKKEMPRWSLLGLVQHLANKAHQWDIQAVRAEADFRSFHLSDTAFFPGMRRLPYPVQQLVLGQMQRGNELLAEGVDPRPLADELECDCLFFRQYHLPCAHMWQQEHLFGGILEDEAVWDDYAFMFEDCGLEIYEGMEVTYSTKELGEEIGAPARRGLEVREICDSLLQRYYRLEDAAVELSEQARDSLFARWITHLGKVTGPIRKMGITEALGSLPEIPWAWVEATDSQLRAEGATESQLEERRQERQTGRMPGGWGLDEDSELEG